MRLAEIVPLGRVDCESAAQAVSLIAAGEPFGARRGREHVAECLRCQAEVAAYRRMLRVMRSMGDEELTPPAGALGDAIGMLHTAAAVARPGAPLPVGRGAVRAATVGGLTAATAAGAAGVLVWLGRRRSTLIEAG